MSKVIYNASWGGYSLPDIVVENYCKLKDIEIDKSDEYFLYRIGHDLTRHDPDLVKVVEEFLNSNSEEAINSSLAITDIGESSRYYIEEYDGMEYVYTDKNIPWTYIE